MAMDSIELTFDTNHLQIPYGWQFGDVEEFRLTVLMTEPDSEEFRSYLGILHSWLFYHSYP